MEREHYYEDERRMQDRGGRYEPSRYDDRGNYERGSNGRHESSSYEGRRGGYAENVGQGGYFGDHEGHSEIGRRGGQIRHERAMRAPHDEEGHAEDVGQGGYFGDYERHSEIGRRGGQIRHERAMRARHDLDEPDDRGRRRFSSYGNDDDRYGRQYRG